MSVYTVNPGRSFWLVTAPSGESVHVPKSPGIGEPPRSESAALELGTRILKARYPGL